MVDFTRSTPRTSVLVFLETTGYCRALPGGKKDVVLKPEKFHSFEQAELMVDGLRDRYRTRELSSWDVAHIAYTFSYNGIPFADLPREARFAILHDSFVLTEFRGVPLILRLTEEGGFAELSLLLGKSMRIKDGELILSHPEIVGDGGPLLFREQRSGLWITTLAELPLVVCTDTRDRYGRPIDADVLGAAADADPDPEEWEPQPDTDY